MLPQMDRSNIRKAYVASFLKNLQFFGPISVPYFLDWLRVDYTRLFILQAWFLLWVFLLEIPTGVVADKFGRKISVALGCVLFSAGFNLFSAILLANVRLLENAIGVRRLLLFTALVPGVLFILLGVAHSLAFAIPALFELVGCRMLRLPILNAFINRHVESENRAIVISSVSLLERLVTFLLYPIVGMLADASLDHALWLLGGSVWRLPPAHVSLPCA